MVKNEDRYWRVLQGEIKEGVIMKRVSFLTFCVLLALPLVVCTGLVGDTLAAGKPIEIGWINPMTGPVSATGDINHKGAQFAVEKINAAGGIKSLGGRKIKLIVGDSEGKAQVGVNQTERLIRRGVVGLQGCYQSGVTYPATAVAERQKVPFLVSMAYADPITQRGFKYTFRLCTRTGLLGVDMLAFTRELYKAHNTPFKTAAFIFDESLYGKMLWDSIEPIYKKGGIEIKDMIFHPVGATDVSAEVVRAKKAKADAFFIHAYASDGILFVKTMRELGFNPPAVICPGAGPKVASYLESLGRLAEYVYVLNDTNWDVSERSKKLNKEFKKRHGIDLSGLSMFDYAGVWVWKEVLEKAGTTDREKIRETFATIEITNPEIMEVLPFEKIKFGPDGQNMYVRNTMAMVKGGVLQTVWPRENASFDWVFPAPTWEEKLKGK
jgi:branched-chain amino acid transport system substrate-binding protein